MHALNDRRIAEPASEKPADGSKMLLRLRPGEPLPPGVRALVRRALESGEALAFPTETSYALGGNALSAPLVDLVYRLKGRERAKPLLLLVDGGVALDAWVRDVPAASRTLIERFWPGPLTLVLRAAPALPMHLPDARGTVAVRWSPHPTVAALLALGGVPLIGTSANRGGAPALHTAQAVLQAFPGERIVALDGGPTAAGPPSTVLDATVLPFAVVREGALPIAAIRAALESLHPEAVPV